MNKITSSRSAYKLQEPFNAAHWFEGLSVSTYEPVENDCDSDVQQAAMMRSSSVLVLVCLGATIAGVIRSQIS